MTGDIRDALGGIRESMRRYPGCTIANCECDERGGEWKPGCFCMGHWQAMDKEFGSNKDDWNISDAAASAKVGKPVRAE